ncbi:MAG: 3-hydroxybutyryl-CoA dehydrogenase [bacterium]
MKIKTVGVLGCGTMGSGIAIVVSSAGYKTIISEISQERIDDGLTNIEMFFAKGVKKGKMTEDENRSAMERIAISTDQNALENCQIIIEAIYEDLELKRKIFAELDRVCPPETIFATNTSVLSITAIAAGSNRPDRVIGMHFCNPAPLMKLVELTRALQTSDETYTTAKEFGKSLGKVLVNTKDSPGFIVNLFLIPYNNDCIRALEAGLATAEDIDTAVKLGLGYPMGPFELLDVIGLDVHIAVAEALYEQLKDHRFAPPPLAYRMRDAGYLGRKTGRGFYRYDEKSIFGA